VTVCPCLGTLTAKLSLTPDFVNQLLGAFVLYWFFGSARLSFGWLPRRGARQILRGCLSRMLALISGGIRPQRRAVTVRRADSVQPLGLFALPQRRRRLWSARVGSNVRGYPDHLYELFRACRILRESERGPGSGRDSTARAEELHLANDRRLAGSHRGCSPALL